MTCLQKDEIEFLGEALKIYNDEAKKVFPSLDTIGFRSASSDEIALLKSLGNVSSDWSKFYIVTDADDSTLNKIRRCNFCGLIFVSHFTEAIDEIDGFAMPSGLYDSYFSGKCYISRSCHVSSTSMVSNVFLGYKAGIINCGSVTCKDYVRASSQPFSDQLLITVGSETGGRSVTTFAGMNFLDICAQVFCSNTTPMQIEAPADDLFCFSIISFNTILIRCDRVHNSHVGPKCRITSSNLDSCTLLSTIDKPITVSSGARLSHCIMNESCSAINGCLAEYLYMCENSSIGDCARIAHCVLGPDGSIAGGECHSSLLGPFAGFHHQSLLIASLWPQGRGNIAYGAKIGANHTGRVSDQECVPGEGMFFGLGCAVKFPSNLLESPYSIVASGTLLPPQKISFPFSLISPLDRPVKSGNASASQCSLSPGWVILSNPYMIDRAAKKFSGRRKAVHHCTDFPIMRPWILNLVRTAKHRLDEALRGLGAKADPLEAYTALEVPGLGLCVVLGKDMLKGQKAYTAMLQKYALHGLLYLLERIKCTESKDRLPYLHKLRSMRQVAVPPRSEGWVPLMADLRLLSLPATDSNSTDTTESFKKSYHSSNSCDMDVLGHQLRVLEEEYPAAGLDRAIDGWTFSGADGAHLTDSFGALGILLEDLCRLENEHASAVSSCRERDGIKGRQVIPDYDDVNVAGGCTLLDPIVEGAAKRARDVADAVSRIAEENPYVIKMRSSN